MIRPLLARVMRWALRCEIGYWAEYRCNTCGAKLTLIDHDVGDIGADYDGEVSS